MRYLIVQSAGHNAGQMNFSKIEAIVAHIYGEVFTAMADAITASRNDAQTRDQTTACRTYTIVLGATQRYRRLPY
jgi:hypothetical protein